MQIRAMRALFGALVTATGCGAEVPFVLPLVAPVVEAPREAEPLPRMPTAVRSLLARRCGGCHTSGPRDRAGWGSVLDVGRLLEAGFIVPGEPGASKLLALVAAGEMPQKGPPLRPREIERLARWIVELGKDAAALGPAEATAGGAGTL